MIRQFGHIGHLNRNIKTKVSFLFKCFLSVCFDFICLFFLLLSNSSQIPERHNDHVKVTLKINFEVQEKSIKLFLDFNSPSRRR